MDMHFPLTSGAELAAAAIAAEPFEPAPAFTAAADLAAAMADWHFVDPDADAPDGPLPLPKGGRELLLSFLSLAYPPQFAQARLHGAPDAAIAWQVQSCLDEFADYRARDAYVVPAYVGGV